MMKMMMIEADDYDNDVEDDDNDDGDDDVYPKMSQLVIVDVNSAMFTTCWRKNTCQCTNTPAL